LARVRSEPRPLPSRCQWSSKWGEVWRRSSPSRVRAVPRRDALAWIAACRSKAGPARFACYWNRRARGCVGVLHLPGADARVRRSCRRLAGPPVVIRVRVGACRKSSPNALMHRVAEVLRGHDEISQFFGEDVKVFGEDLGGRREGRRFHVPDYTYERDGVTYTRYVGVETCGVLVQCLSEGLLCPCGCNVALVQHPILHRVAACKGHRVRRVRRQGCAVCPAVLPPCLRHVPWCPFPRCAGQMNYIIVQTNKNDIIRIVDRRLPEVWVRWRCRSRSRVSRAMMRPAHRWASVY
jgi:hypothetical protein